MYVLTWLAVVVGTAWPSCFKVLGLRPEKLSGGTVVKKEPDQLRAKTSENTVTSRHFMIKLVCMCQEQVQSRHVIKPDRSHKCGNCTE